MGIKSFSEVVALTISMLVVTLSSKSKTEGLQSWNSVIIYWNLKHPMLAGLELNY
jgi:hypothetical protein